MQVECVLPKIPRLVSYSLADSGYEAIALGGSLGEHLSDVMIATMDLSIPDRLVP